MPINRGIARLCLGAICISFAPVFVKMLGMDLMSPTSIAFWRMLIGSMILFTWASVKNGKVSISRLVLGWAALAGILFSVDLFFWHRSIVYSGAGIATILANTQVFGTAVLSFFIFKEKLTLKFLVAALAAFGGVALLVGFGSGIEMSTLYIRGVIYGLVTGLAYANFLVTLKYAGQKQALPDFLTLIAWVSLFSALSLGIMVSIEGGVIMPPDLYSLFVLFLLALVAQTLGWWAITSGLSEVTASRAGLIILLQPVLAAIWGILFFAEGLTPTQFAGAALTLICIYLGSQPKKKPIVPVAG